MASAFAHGATGALLATLWWLLFDYLGDNLMGFGWWFWIISTIISALPDIDYVFGQEYLSLFGHRGFTHGIFFAVIIGIICAFISIPIVTTVTGETFISWQFWNFVIFYFGATIAHSIEDSMVCCRIYDPYKQKYIKQCFDIGPAYLSPFSNTRETMCRCYHPILVSPLGVKAFFSKYGCQVLWTEFYYVALPLIMLNVITFLVIHFTK